MSEGKHTPGPWRVYAQEIADKDQAKHELCQLVDGTPNFQNVMVYVTDDDWNLAPAVTGCGEHSIANAHLIAAAPDLLAALLSVRQIIVDGAMTGFNPKDGDWAERLYLSQAKSYAAIARAEGRTE